MAKHSTPNEEELAAWLASLHASTQSPVKVMWQNLWIGIYRGLGAAIGATLVLAVLIWALSKMAQLPVVGEYFKTVTTKITEYAEATQYADDFERIERELKLINRHLSAGEVDPTQPND